MTKDQLRAYRSIKLEGDKLADLIREMEATIYGPKALRADGMPRGGNGPGRPTETAASQHAALLQRYEAKLEELDKAMAAVEDAIEVLDPRARTLMRLYYAQGLTWEEVCRAMHYSWRQVHRIHSNALSTLRAREETAKKCD